MMRPAVLTLALFSLTTVTHAAAPAPRAPGKRLIKTKARGPKARPAARKTTTRRGAAKATTKTKSGGKRSRRLRRFRKADQAPAVSFTPCSAAVPESAPAPAPKKKGKGKPGLEGFVAENTWFWPNGATLNIHFMDGTPEARQAVAELAKEWTDYANLKFEFFLDPDNPPPETHIRIRFDYGACNSSLGTSSSYSINRGDASMNLCHIDNRMGSEFFERVVRHEFGHALGIHHEHQNPKHNIPWDKPVVYEYYSRTQGWDEAFVDLWVFRQIDPSLVVASEWDPKSVMHYGVPKEFTTDDTEVIRAHTISETDKEYVAKIYPKAKKPKGANTHFYERMLAVRNDTAQTIDVRVVSSTKKKSRWVWAPSRDPERKGTSIRLSPGEERMMPGGKHGRSVRFIAKAPGSGDIWSGNRSKALSASPRGGYLEREMQTFVVAVEGEPDSPNLGRSELYAAADDAYAAGEHAKARAHYEEFARRFDSDELTPWAKLGVASTWIEQDRHSEALLASYGLITDHPDSEAAGYAWFYGGVSSLALGKCTDARAYFDFVADPSFGLPKSWQSAAKEFITSMKSKKSGCG